jgi:cardiolipin synthase
VSIPNFISLARLLTVPIIVWLMLEGQWFWAFLLFCASGVSDAVDGFLAKKFNMQTRLGRFLDPIADKSLLVAIYITLGVQELLPTWLVILVASRDLLIVGGVLLLYALNLSYEPSPLLISKINTAMQIGLAAMILAQLGLPWPQLAPWADWLVVIVAFTTVVSGAGYLVDWSRRMNKEVEMGEL